MAQFANMQRTSLAQKFVGLLQIWWRAIIVMDMQFVLFHGAFGSADGNWFPELKQNLEALGQQVIVPQFPVDDWNTVTEAGSDIPNSLQTLDNWLATFEKILPSLQTGEKLCFVGHSLGCVFMLHALERYNLQLDSAIFVSPFFDTLHRDWQIDHVNQSFYKIDFDFEKLKQLMPVSYVLYSDNDPYVDRNHSIIFGKALDSSMIFVRRAGHMNAEVNLREFPLILDLCNTRLDLDVWQDYLIHRKQLWGLEYVQSRPETLAIFKPEEIFDWRVYLYQSLSKSGFCTFFTGTDFWDTQSKYYQDARIAAKRIGDFTRVFVVEDEKDLQKDLLHEQIKLDLEAGIHIYLCDMASIKDAVPELDFGIWDEHFLCVVKFDADKQVTGVEINTRQADVNKAHEWQRAILQHSRPVSSLKDLQVGSTASAT